MTLPPLTYLSVDGLSEGVGRSQVLAYVERLGRRGLDVTVHSFEKQTPDPAIDRQLAAAGVRWRPHRFGPGGAVGGLGRVARGAKAIMGSELVHARSESAAASALVAHPPRWIWDMRGFWRLERIALGLMRPGSPEERVMRAVETRAAHASAAVVTLSQAAVDVLGERFGPDVRAKSRVITTCVELDRFTVSPPPSSEPLRFLLVGTLNGLYDVESMVRLVECVRARRKAELTVLSPNPARWQSLFARIGATVGSASPAAMPDWVRAHHVGLSLRRPQFGMTSIAATPTKLGEFLACGRPVVVSAGLGDLDTLVARHDCGVIIRDTSDCALSEAADDLARLVDDPGTPDRCRALAEEHFDVERGVDQLLDLYRYAVR